MPAFRNLTPYVERRLVCTSNNTVQYEWYTNWMSVDGIDNIRAVLKAKNATGANFQWQLAIQYAAVRGDDPGAPATLGNAQTNSGEYQTGDISVAANAAAQRLFRLGIAYTVSGVASAVQQGDVCLQASWKQVGTDLGRMRVTISASDTGTKYEALTGWVPATFMAKVKAALVMTSITGTTQNLRYQLAYQTAGTMVQQPGSWTNAEAGWSTPTTSYNERNTGELTLTTTDMWFRIGVAYSLTSGSTTTTAVLDAICACR